MLLFTFQDHHFTTIITSTPFVIAASLSCDCFWFGVQMRFSFLTANRRKYFLATQKKSFVK